MTHRETQTRPPLAIVGVSALFPGSLDANGFWCDILAGKDLLTDVPETHWLPEDYYDEDPSAPDKTYAKRGGFLPKVDFDALHWGVPPSIIEATDTSQLLALILAEQVLQDAANGQFETMDRSRISCILGVTSAQELLGTMVSRLQHPIWRKSLREHGLPESEVDTIVQRIGDHYVQWQESSFPGLLGNVVAGRIANRLDLGGTNCVSDAACASTFSALSMAVHELYLGDSDLVITGGVDTLNDIFMYMCFSKTPALSATGDCRPFSDQADGTMLGEGLGMIALKRLADAERDGDRIYAVLSGVGASSDGRSKSVYAPVSEGQANALRRAYEFAGFGPETVELIEAHGTGTKAGDVAEFGGLKLAFSDADRTDTQWCALGSVKSQIGHTKAASGAAGLFKAVMALHHKVLPPTIKIDRPNDKLNIESSPFFLNTEARPWIRGASHPRRAGVSSFGFGGSNFHLALEEYQGNNPHAHRVRGLAAEVIAISAADGAGVAAQARLLSERAEDEFHRVVWECAQSFDSRHTARLAIVAVDGAELATKLRRTSVAVAKDPEKAFVHPDGSAYGVGEQSGGIAFLFPGQGSQYVGMGGALAMTFDAARGPWDRAADLDIDAAQRIDQVVFPIPRFDDAARLADDTTLRATEWAQPAIGTASLSMLALMRQLGVTPDAVAGHSFGEITALHAAGVLTETEMLQVARRRGELMAAAGELPGAMSAVSAEIEIVVAALEKLGRADVVIANHNAPTQVVISGAVDGVDAAETALKADGVRCKRLDVATAFHSPVVASSEAPFGAFLADITFSKAATPVWSGESATPYAAKDEDKRQRLAQQIANPVRFVDLLNGLSESGVRTFVEVGPGSILTGLVGRTLDASHRAIALDRRGANGVVSLGRGIAQLVAAGVHLDLNALWEGFGEPIERANRPKIRLAVPISGANHGRLYPPEGGAASLPAPNPPRPEPVAVVYAPAVAASAAQATAPVPVAATADPNGPTQRAARAAAQTGPVAVAPATQTPPPVVPVAARAMSANAAAQTATLQAGAPRAPQAAPQQAHGVSDGWLAAWQEAMRQNASAHTAFSQAMSQSHTAFLSAMETSIAGLATLAGGASVGVPTAVMAGSPETHSTRYANTAPATVPQPILHHTPAPQPILHSAPAPQPVLHAAPAPQPVLHAAPAPQPLLHAAPPPGRIAQTTTAQATVVQPPVSAAATAAPALDLHSLMLAVVADKTGYPTEMLELEMDLEGDLGIDSIKRVEILAAVQDQAPGMPDVDAARMGALKTLGEIVDYMQGLLGTAAVAAAAPAPVGAQTAPVTAASPQLPAQAHAAPTLDLHSLMLTVVAEKTGYPAEMLELEMNLEGDLGIDSIKRVEILAAVQDQAPGMPEVDAARMGALKTLGEIVDYMQGLLGTPAVPSATPAPAPVAAHTAPPATASPQAHAAPTLDLHGLMLSVVAEKTGYPADMLELEMNLEGDLGIDSIKRVEILAAVQDQAPGMPEVDAARMGALKTLGEIVDYMQGLLGTPAVPVTTAATPAGPIVTETAIAAPALDLHALMLTVVADKTGYPADMLELDMNLEGDLGIDSIKRVEILAAVQDQAPGMPEVDAARMGALKTLGEIVEYMQSLLGGATSEVAQPSGPVADLAHAAPAQGTTKKNFGRYTLQMQPCPALGLAQPTLRSAHEVLVTQSGSELTQALVAELQTRGVNAVATDHVPADAGAVIFLGGLRPVTDAEQAIAVEREAFGVARTLAPAFTERGGLFVTVQDTGGAFGTTAFSAERAFLAGLPALVKTASQEWPQASLKAIDLACGSAHFATQAMALADELLLGGGELEVGIGSDLGRVSPRSVWAPVETADALIGKDDVVVVSGGGRGVTAACVIEWARDTGARFVLLGRSSLAPEPACCAAATTDPELKRALLADAKSKGLKLTTTSLGKQVARILAGREIQATIEAIEAAGGQARYCSASVTDADALRTVLDEVRKDWGPVQALIHGAGVLADRKIGEQTDEEFDRVFDTKIEGLRTLLQTMSVDPLRVICLFSSVSARCGNNGQCTYAMANEVLNKIAWSESRARGGDVLVKSLGWGPWEGGMVSPQLQAHFAKLGVPMIPLDVGARMLADELRGAQPAQVEIVLGGEPRAEALMVQGSEARILELEVRLSRDTHPYLGGHAIGGSVVVPVVLVLEWFSRVARAFRSDLHLEKIEKLNVLKGIQIQDFEGRGEQLVIRCRQLSNGHGAVLGLELRNPDGVVHYRAQAQMVETRPLASTDQAPNLPLQDWGGAPIYGDVLFHTDLFQVIQTLDGVSDDGISGTLNGVDKANWGWERWDTDVAAMDGGLQLVLLWARAKMGGAVLPMSIGELRTTGELPPQGPIRAVAHCRAESKNRGVADVVFHSETGERFAELRGIEVILRPDWPIAEA